MKHRIVILLFLVLSGAFDVMAQIDLSHDECANCYIVSEAGTYSFRATIGNSGKRLKSMTSADWLWQTDKKMISDVNYAAGVVTFKYNGTKGNAVIAGLDSESNIVWSWHIWATDDPCAETHFIYEESMSLMDRNLGAISTEVDNVDSYGLFYQWGRKDPFIGGAVPGEYSVEVRYEEAGFCEGTANAWFNPAFEGIKWFNVVRNDNNAIATGKSIEYAISHPSTFICFGAEVNGSEKGSWYNEEARKFDRSWGYYSPRRPVVKTVHDPCPPGWQVPTSSSIVWCGFEMAEPAGTLAGRNYYFKGKAFFYPAAGTRRQVNGRIQYSGAVGTYWSATPKGASAMAMSMEDERIRINLGIPRAMGASVRCMKMQQ